MPVAKKTKEETPVTPHYDYGTGRRKTAIAQVRVLAGSGKFLLNDKETELFPHLKLVLEMVGLDGKVDISAHVHGGGSAGQIIAIRHGLARALTLQNADFRAVLKKAGFLTRDPRERERKKYGLHSARRGPQFSKR